MAHSPKPPGGPISTNYGVSRVVAADFNGDGIPDLALAGGYYLVVLLGKGDGTFSEVPIGSASIAQAELFGSMLVESISTATEYPT